MLAAVNCVRFKTAVEVIRIDTSNGSSGSRIVKIGFYLLVMNEEFAIACMNLSITIPVLALLRVSYIPW